MTKQQNKERFVNVLLSEISYQQNKGDGWWEDVKGKVDTVAENYHNEYYEEHDEYHLSIHHTTQVYMNTVPHISSPYNMDLIGMMEETLDRYSANTVPALVGTECKCRMHLVGG